MHSHATIARARDFRRNMTGPERALWWQLRSDVFKPFNFRRQAPVGPWFADFVSHRMKLVIELDGDTHTPHHDARRDAWFAGLGYTTLRFPNAAVAESAEGVAEETLDWLRIETLRQAFTGNAAAPP
jgi:very-short-patch-repair endonuclease